MPERSSAERDVGLSRQIRRYALLLLLVALLLATWGVISRITVRNALAKEAVRNSVVTVLTIVPERSGAGEDLALPGTVQAFV